MLALFFEICIALLFGVGVRMLFKRYSTQWDIGNTIGAIFAAAAIAFGVLLYLVLIRHISV